MIFSVIIYIIIIYVIKMQIKHVIISNLITGWMLLLRQRTLSRVNMRQGALQLRHSDA